MFPYLVLHRMGFTQPRVLLLVLVGSYPTLSPLPPTLENASSAVYSLLHLPSGSPAWPLTSILPYGARTFLDAVKPHRDNPKVPRSAYATTRAGGYQTISSRNKMKRVSNRGFPARSRTKTQPDRRNARRPPQQTGSGSLSSKRVCDMF